MNYVNLRGRTKAVQFGIVTAGHSECGRGARGFPGVYTDINFYMEWILNNMQEWEAFESSTRAPNIEFQ